ncbi:MAG: DUF6324 family protein [Pikeienuella sp.]
MGIDSDSDIAASLRIGPTSLGMVRIYIEADGVSLPMDFDPQEALEIAEEITAAAERAKSVAAGSGEAEAGARSRKRRAP